MDRKYIQIVFVSLHSIHLAHRERAASGQWNQTAGIKNEADPDAYPELKGQLPQDIFSASVINLLLAEEEEMAVWKKRIKQRKLAHLEDSKKNGKQVVNNLQNVNSEKSATAEIDN